MNVQRRNNARIYCLSSGPTLPEWLGERARRNLSKRDESIRRRIELIQDFQMPSSSSKIAQSSDGRYLIAAGTYPPRIRCYDVHDLTMKFERYVNSHVYDIAMLGEDFGKFALLLEDRTIAFHAPYGSHESIRIPTFGRGMAYEPSTCELLLAAKGNQVFRINLDEGRFSEPWMFEPSTASASCIAVGPTHALAAVGCDDGLVRFWDNRSPDTLLRPFLTLDVHSATSGFGYADNTMGYTNLAEITSIAHEPGGLYMAAGTAGGLVALYDVRSSRPLHILEHKHGMPIHTVKFHSGSGCVISSDEKLVKIWRYRGSGEDSRVSAGSEGDETAIENAKAVGSVLTNVEGTGKFSHFVMAGDESDPFGNRSGLLLCATDQPKMESFYIPSVGLAPKWCSFLESITEELEERDLARDGSSSATDIVKGGESIYENYKFVSRDEVEKLGISNLVGTPLLRGYMHGFFLDINFYNKVRAVANPFEYEEYRKKKLKEKVEAKRASRIAPKVSKAAKHSVNPELATRLSDKADDNTKSGKVAKQVLSDDRFKGLFSNPDYQIDEKDENFKLRNPSGIAASKRRRNDLDSDEEGSEVEDEQEAETFDQVNSESNEESAESEESDSDSDVDGFRGAKVRGEMYEQMKSLKPSHKGQKTIRKKKADRKPVMYETDLVEDAVGLAVGETSVTDKSKRRHEERHMSLEQLVALKESEKPNGSTALRLGEGASRETTFIPRDVLNRREKEAASHGEEANQGGRKRGRKRRGVKELGFRTPFKNSR